MSLYEMYEIFLYKMQYIFRNTFIGFLYQSQHDIYILIQNHLQISALYYVPI